MGGRTYIRRRAYVGQRQMQKAARLDHDHLWHPFTQQRDWVGVEPLMIESAHGAELIDTDGRRYLDGVSSLWCNVRPSTSGARRGGARQLDHVAHPRCSASHPGAAEPAARSRSEIAPGLSRVFYSDLVSVEV